MTLNYIDLFDRAARPAADRVALIDDTGSLTYGAVRTLTHRIAHALVGRGLAPSTRFAVMSPNTSLAMVALLGALRAGGAWCNINLRNALAVNIDVLRRGGCEVVFYHSSCAGQMAELLAGVPSLKVAVCLDQPGHGHPSLAEFAGEGSDEPINVRLAAEAVGLQGSTGGTTGSPKIAQAGPQFLSMNALGFMSVLPFDRPPVNLAVAPITHAGGIVAQATLAMGGRVVMMPVPDLGKLLQAIETYKVSLLFLPPTVIYTLMNHPRCRETDFSSLRYLMAAAAPFAPEKIAAAHAVFGPVVCQSFGQTESGFPLTFMSPADVNAALADPALASRLKSVGQPTPNVAGIEIVDDTGRVLGPGEVGEIVVRGPTTMFAYVGDPEATAAIRRDGWQHTGDLGYRDAAGFVYISDRKRDLIITGGFNVFPFDVEQALVGHPAVQDAAVIGVPDEKWGEAVKAVVELAPGKSVGEDELIAWCKERLGSVIAPKSVDFVEQLPRSAVGKVLKRALRDQYWQGRERRI